MFSQQLFLDSIVEKTAKSIAVELTVLLVSMLLCGRRVAREQ
jgi:hypothetical protein